MERKAVEERLMPIVWVAVLAYGASQIAIYATGGRPTAAFSFAPLLFLLLIVLGFGRRPETPRVGRGVWLPLLPFALFTIWYLFKRLFGEFSLAPILFHLQYELESNGLFLDFLRRISAMLLPFLLVGVAWWQLSARRSILRTAGEALFFPLLVLNPFSFGIADYVREAHAQSSVDLLAHYREPPAARSAGRQANLIHVYLESTERTLWNEAVFGDIAAPLKRLESQGFSATGIEQVKLTNWTLAGQVASSCGVPLLSVGLLRGNRYDHAETIMPEAACLSDILARDGYEMTFMKAAGIAFAGTDTFLESHGYTRWLGFHELGANYPAASNPWGLDDEDLFDAAWQEISRLRDARRPYAVTLTTLGGHAPEGYVSRSCLKDPAITALANTTLKAFACTNRLAAAFVDRLAAAGNLEDTIVVLQSDHLAMRNHVYETLKTLDRRNSFIMLGPGISPRLQSGARASLVDIYPTILEALGYSLPDDRAGLGVSLLSQRETLLRQIGLNRLNRAILSDSALRDRLWGLHRSM